MSTPLDHIQSLVFFQGALPVFLQMVNMVGMKGLVESGILQCTLFPRGKVTVEDAILRAYEKHPRWTTQRWIEFILSEAPKVSGKDQLFQRVSRYPKLVSRLREYFANLFILRTRGIAGTGTTRVD